MLPERTLLGRYRIVRFIGRGGMGEAYLAEDTHLRRQVAIKVIAPQADSRKLAEALRLFQREMQAIARLDHPHILPLYDYGEDTVDATKYTYMVMPFREDGTLEAWLEERKDKHAPFPRVEDVAQIVSQAASALQRAHDDPAQILHLDVKLSNFLIRNNLEHPNYPDLLLADFGTTKIINATGDVTDTVRGSVAYMPPEQWQRNPQPASDQYALAIMIYEILTYQKTVQGTPEQMMYQHLHENPQPPSTINPRIPAEIDAVILKALAKNFQDRYPTITAFADAFKQALVNNADTRVLLSISKAEAQSGVAYPLTLPGGRRITIAVPAGVHDGQSMRQEGMGEPAYAGGPARALIITIAVKPGPDNNREITNHLQNLSQQMRTLSQEVANLQTQIAKNTIQQQSSPNDITMRPPDRGNQQNVPPRSYQLPRPPYQNPLPQELSPARPYAQNNVPTPESQPQSMVNGKPIYPNEIRAVFTLKGPYIEYRIRELNDIFKEYSRAKKDTKWIIEEKDELDYHSAMGIKYTLEALEHDIFFADALNHYGIDSTKLLEEIYKKVKGQYKKVFGDQYSEVEIKNVLLVFVRYRLLSERLRNQMSMKDWLVKQRSNAVINRSPMPLPDIK